MPLLRDASLWMICTILDIERRRKQLITADGVIQRLGIYAVL